MGVYKSHYVAPDDGDDDKPRRGRHAVPDGDDYPDQGDHYPRAGFAGSASARTGSRPKPNPRSYGTSADSSPHGSGTVYGRPRQAGPWDGESPSEPVGGRPADHQAGTSVGRHSGDDAGDDPEPYGRAAAEGYGRATSGRRSRRSRYDSDDGYHDEYDDDGYRGQYQRRDDDSYGHDDEHAGYHSDGHHGLSRHGRQHDRYNLDDRYADRYGDHYHDDRYEDRYHDRYEDDRDARHYDEDRPYRGRYDDRDDEAGYNRRRQRSKDGHDDRGRKNAPDPMAGVRAGVRGFGELLITFGLVVLLFAGYEVWGKSAQVDAAQNALDDKLEDSWGGKAPKEKPLPGDAIARLHIPRLEKHWVVVEGVAPGDIKNAPGHYPDSAMPGEVGNFSTAGHRMPAVFWNLHTMQKDDKIFLEDNRYWYEYRVTEIKIVLPHQVEVVAPVPGKPGARATDAMLTITTCNPQWDNYERLVVHAKLAGKPKSKDQGRPPALAD